MNNPLMPKSTAVWLIDNTALTFEQISKFCNLHILEVQGIADGEVAVGIQGKNPVTSGELTLAEIKRCEGDSTQFLNKLEDIIPLSSEINKKKKSFTPASRRQLIPDAIAWFIKYYPDLTDAQIIKLIGTTKNTIKSIRDRSHWNSQNIRAQNPFELGFCSKEELEELFKKYVKKDRKSVV